MAAVPDTPQPSRLHQLVEITTDISVLLRELCIVALFCLLFFSPGTFKSLLTGIGISKVSTVFGDIDVTEAGGTVATLNHGLADTVARLQQIQSTSTDPQAKEDLAQLTQSVQGLQQQAQTADDSLKTKIATQQTAADLFAANAAAV